MHCQRQELSFKIQIFGEKMKKTADQIFGEKMINSIRYSVRKCENAKRSIGRKLRELSFILDCYYPIHGARKEVK